MHVISKIALGALSVLVLLAIGGTSLLAYQGAQKPDTSGAYVALGSSFAAGIGLGPAAPHSPVVCQRSSMGYPSLIAKKTGLRLVDMTCSGSTTRHILEGGQVFLPAQLAAIGPDTTLVTVTSGGNDVGYIGDLMLAAGKLGPLRRRNPSDVVAPDMRDYVQVKDGLTKIVQSVQIRAPNAIVMLVSYPTVLPPRGSCPALQIDERQAAISREVAARLLAATKAAATQSGAIFVDAAAASVGHDACSAVPWVTGASPTKGIPFHPTDAGSTGVADLVVSTLASIAQRPEPRDGIKR